MKEYYSLLQSNLVLRRLSTVQLLSYFGVWFSNVAIYTLLLQLNVSAQIIAFTAMLHFLSGIAQAPISGSIIDAMKPKKLMLTLIMIQFIATFCLIFINNVADLNFLYILIVIKMAAASFYFTTEMSLLPKVLPSQKLQKANELHSIIWSLSYTLGMAISGFVVYAFGIKTAFLLDAVMFIVAFYLLFTLEINVSIIKQKERLLQMMGDTFRYLRKFPHAMHLMLIHSFVGITAFDALVALMVDKYYASIIATSLALGLLNASRAIGLVIGPMILAKWINNKRLTYLFLFQAASLWLWAYLMHNFYLSLFASLIVGLFTTTLWSYSYTLLQKNIDEKYYGRIVAYNDMLFLSSASLTSYLIGYLTKNGISLEMTTVFMGGSFAVGALYFLWIYKTQNLKEV